jgi:hypothetical protein
MNFLKRLFCELPLWAYGIECEICQMTFISPEAHYNQVIKKKIITSHKDKIPILKK